MTIEANIEAGAENVIPMNNTQVIEELRRRHPACRSRRVDVWLVEPRGAKGSVVEDERWHIGPRGIRLALGEKESETRVPGGELVDDAGREHAAPAERQV